MAESISQTIGRSSGREAPVNVIGSKVALYGSTSLMSKRFVSGRYDIASLYDGPQYGAETGNNVPLLYGELLISGNIVDGGVSQSQLDPARVLQNYRIIMSDGVTAGLGEDGLSKTYVNCVAATDDKGANLGDIALTAAGAAAMSQGIPYLFNKLIPKPKDKVEATDPVTGEPIKSLEQKATTKLKQLSDVNVGDVCENFVMVQGPEGKWIAKHINDLLRASGISISGGMGGTGGKGGNGGTGACDCDDGETPEPTNPCDSVTKDLKGDIKEPPANTNGPEGSALLNHKGTSKVYNQKINGSSSAGVTVHLLFNGLYTETSNSANNANSNAAEQSEGNITSPYPDAKTSQVPATTKQAGSIDLTWCLFGNGKKITGADISFSGYNPNVVSQNFTITWADVANACVGLSPHEFVPTDGLLDLRLERKDNYNSSTDVYFQGTSVIPGQGLLKAVVSSGLNTPTVTAINFFDDKTNPSEKPSGGFYDANSCPADPSDGSGGGGSGSEGEEGQPGSPGTAPTLNIPDTPTCTPVPDPDAPPPGTPANELPANKASGDFFNKLKPSLNSDLWKLLGGIAGATAGGMLTQFFLPHTSTTNIQLPQNTDGEEIKLAFLYKGMVVEIPDNYDPVARSYTGEWDRMTYKQDWTDDPAWCVRDYLFNKKYGCGDSLNLNAVEMQTLVEDLYQASKRNNEKVQDGYGGYEARYTMNAYFTGEMTKLETIQAMASTMHAQFLFVGTGIRLVQDRPDTPKLLVNQASVESEGFNFSGGSVKATYNWVDVTWNNPSKFFRQDVVYVNDPDMIAKQGTKTISEAAFGCTREGQALRHGRWVIQTEQSNPLTVTYIAGFDHYDLIPNDIVSIEDDMRSLNAPSGRLLSASGTTVIVDREVEDYLPGSRIHLMMPDGSIFSSPIVSVMGNTVTITDPLLGVPVPGAIYNIDTEDNAQLFRILKKVERDTGEFEITAIKYYSDKYEAIDAPYKLGIGGNNFATTALGLQSAPLGEIDQSWSGA